MQTLESSHNWERAMFKKKFLYKSILGGDISFSFISLTLFSQVLIKNSLRSTTGKV